MNNEEERTLVPYEGEVGEPYREWASPREEEEPILEAEFREVGEEPPPTEEEFRGFQEKQAYRQRVEEWEEKEKREERREKLEEQAREKKEREREISELEEKASSEELKAIRRKYRRQYRPSIPSVAKKIQMIATLGGAPSKKRLTEMRELYIPRARPGTYVPTGMRRLTSFGEESLQEVTEPKLGRLQRAGALPERGRIRPGVAPPMVSGVGLPVARTGAISPHLARAVVPQPHGLISIKGQSVALGLLREVSTPKGLMPVERYAYAEIVSNNDRDTPRHVASELAALGISRRDAEQAIKALLQKRVIRRTQDFKGEEPILEVVR